MEPKATRNAATLLTDGLVVLRASRLEALLQPLQTLMAATRPDNLLVAQTVVAAHPGMKQWLTRELARLAGSAGVVANLEVILPSAWLDRLAQRQLGHKAVSLPRYQRAHLRWTLHELLRSQPPVAGLGNPQIAHYLAASEHLSAADMARRRFQLADRLAGIYSQYLVYRPDWLQAWEAGKSECAAGSSGPPWSALETQLLAPLWRSVVTRLGRHRAQILGELHASLLADTRARPALHVFGVSHLAPSEMQVIRAYARQAMVALYVPDPCREYWGGLFTAGASAWNDYRADESARIAQAGEGDYWQPQGHPLLARWGRMGQHFFAGLSDGAVREDARHWQDEQADPRRNRLSRLQDSVRQLDPAIMAETPGPAKSCTDASLRIHACHTRLRELEVLRDALLDAIEHEQVRAGDIVVMAPDIGAYAALIPAVFGEPGSSRERRLPYHLADVPLARSHRLFTAFARLLDSAASRVTTPEVVDLLALPEVQRRLGLDANALENLGEWLQQSRVAWALDASHRASFGVPAISEHSFAWGLDRMLAGYLMSDAPQADRERAFTLADGTELVPVTGVTGPGAEALGALDRLLLELQAWHQLTTAAFKASVWAVELQGRLDAIFRVDPMREDEGSALVALKQMIATIHTEAERAEEDPELHFAVVRDLLLDQLGRVPERQPFLLGGVTFCGMVPQRAIPFAVVAVLGLNDGEFPRNRSDGGLDLMTRLRRIGDRDVRSDDRYLFLETVMSARKRLHLSTIGEGVSDGKPRNPAAPLAELMAELDQAAGLTHDDSDAQRPWLVRHPLQPFDERYFDRSDARLFSYNPHYAAMHGAGRAPARPFVQGDAGSPDPLPQHLPLADVLAYYKDPAANLLERRLQLKLDALDRSRLPEDEPLEAAIDRLATVARRMFFQQVLPAWGEWQPGHIPDWVRLTGLLPPGRPGDAAWQSEVAAIEAMMAAARASTTLNADVALQAQTHAVEVEMLDRNAQPPRHYRISAHIKNVFPLGAADVAGWQLLRAYPNAGKPHPLKAEADLHFGDRVALFMEWALLRLHSAANAGAPVPVRITLLVRGDDSPWHQGINAWDEALVRSDAQQQAAMLDALRARVAQLVTWWQQAQGRPTLYFSRTSWVAASLSDDVAAEAKGAQKIQGAWSGYHDSGERDYSPGYNRLLAGDVAFDADAPARAALLTFARELQTVVSLHPQAAP